MQAQLPKKLSILAELKKVVTELIIYTLKIIPMA
jgi:hypothetical protein